MKPQRRHTVPCRACAVELDRAREGEVGLMEETRSLEGVRERANEPLAADVLERTALGTAKGASSEQVLRELVRQKESKVWRRKWGKGLVIAGIVTVLGSCSLLPLPMMKLPGIWFGAIMLLVGMALLARGPRLKETNEALLVAAKYNNRLTVARLALEMDISLEKAEKIIQELVRKDVAEIDLDHNVSDMGIVYKIKGL
ncbi:MAG: hypothetical protein LDL33_03465 [Desulfomonile sp.]|nr:hypothetical protein [Desulfomonile sp.]